MTSDEHWRMIGTAAFFGMYPSLKALWIRLESRIKEWKARKRGGSLQ